MLFSYVVLSQINALDAQIDENNEGLKRAAELINGCVDQYTTIELQANYDEANELKYHIGLVRSFSLLALILNSMPVLLYILALLNNYCCVYNNTEEEQETGKKEAKRADLVRQNSTELEDQSAKK